MGLSNKNNTVIQQSLTYRFLSTLLNYFFFSLSYRFVKNGARSISSIVREAITHSGSRHLYQAVVVVFGKRARTIVMITLLIMQLCHIILGLLMYRKVHAASVTALSLLFITVYVLTPHARDRIVTVFKSSVLYKILQKKI